MITLVNISLLQIQFKTILFAKLKPPQLPRISLIKKRKRKKKKLALGAATSEAGLDMVLHLKKRRRKKLQRRNQMKRPTTQIQMKRPKSHLVWRNVTVTLPGIESCTRTCSIGPVVERCTLKGHLRREVSTTLSSVLAPVTMRRYAQISKACGWLK